MILDFWWLNMFFLMSAHFHIHSGGTPTPDTSQLWAKVVVVGHSRLVLSHMVLPLSEVHVLNIGDKHKSSGILILGTSRAASCFS